MNDPKKEQYFCPAPFVHMVHRSSGNIAPCCFWTKELEGTDSFLGSVARPPIGESDPFNHPWMDRIRDAMIAGHRLSPCKECWHREDLGVQSGRLSLIRDFGRPVVKDLRFLELNLGNLCNMKCRMCGSYNSTKWSADDIALGTPTHALTRTRPEIAYPYVGTIDKLRFVGGEPSLEQETIRSILCKIEDERHTLDHLHVMVTTNALVRFDDTIMTLLGKCRVVEFQCSLDGIGAVNDYQRSGGDFATVVENLRWYQDFCPTNFDLAILTSWSIINLSSAIDTLIFVHDTLPRYSCWGHVVREPEWMDVSNLPYAYKQDMIGRLHAWTDLDASMWITHNKQVLTAQLSLDATLPIDQVLLGIARLDGIRDESFEAICQDTYQALRDSAGHTIETRTAP